MFKLIKVHYNRRFGRWIVDPLGEVCSEVMQSRSVLFITHSFWWCGHTLARFSLIYEQDIHAKCKISASCLVNTEAKIIKSFQQKKGKPCFYNTAKNTVCMLLLKQREWAEELVKYFTMSTPWPIKVSKVLLGDACSCVWIIRKGKIYKQGSKERIMVERPGPPVLPTSWIIQQEHPNYSLYSSIWLCEITSNFSLSIASL